MKISKRRHDLDLSTIVADAINCGNFSLGLIVGRRSYGYGISFYPVYCSAQHHLFSANLDILAKLSPSSC